MVSPFEFERCVLPLGTTTAICDPHEIANVVGVDGIKYFQESSEHTVMDIFVQLSSCVPSTEMGNCRSKSYVTRVEKLKNHKSNIGLRDDELPRCH